MKATRWTAADVSAIKARQIVSERPPKPSKYRNRKVTLDGIEFDSAKESRRWVELKAMQQAGLIKDLRTQYSVKCVVNGVFVCEWIADFVYTDIKACKTVLEDVKSEVTRKLPVYQLKKKLVWATQKIEIKET